MRLKRLTFLCVFTATWLLKNLHSPTYAIAMSLYQITSTVRMCNYLDRVLLDQMGYDPLSRFCSHAHRVVFKEVRRPDQQRQSCWSTLSLLGSLHPKLHHTAAHMVSVSPVYLCFVSMIWCLSLFHCMDDCFFSILIIIPTFHSNNIVVAHFVIETMITADWLVEQSHQK